jgi:hypothetical protein
VAEFSSGENCYEAIYEMASSSRIELSRFAGSFEDARLENVWAEEAAGTPSERPGGKS